MESDTTAHYNTLTWRAEDAESLPVSHGNYNCWEIRGNAAPVTGPFPRSNTAPVTGPFPGRRGHQPSTSRGGWLLGVGSNNNRTHVINTNTNTILSTDLRAINPPVMLARERKTERTLTRPTQRPKKDWRACRGVSERERENDQRS